MKQSFNLDAYIVGPDALKFSRIESKNFTATLAFIDNFGRVEVRFNSSFNIENETLKLNSTRKLENDKILEKINENLTSYFNLYI